MATEEGRGEGECIYRRGPADDFGLVTQVVYRPTEGGYKRSVEKVKQFRRSETALALITERQNWTRFGQAKGAQGKERGVSMVAIDQVLVEDPLSEEANKTGEERLIERLKATVKSKGTHRAQDVPGDDYETYVSNLRPSSNSKYRQSPSKFRNTGPSPGRGYRAGSPAFQRGNNSSSNPRGNRSPTFGPQQTNNKSKSPARKPNTPNRQQPQH